ncbi:hypothetical protein M405DRAFT_263657 [Rhizopogon salebrosus TDB-379]|nr:hypothetical protein M405DRAFT_263657 [Rhizopogon salebrosus TDB-379]
MDQCKLSCACSRYPCANNSSRRCHNGVQYRDVFLPHASQGSLFSSPNYTHPIDRVRVFCLHHVCDGLLADDQKGCVHKTSHCNATHDPRPKNIGIPRPENGSAGTISVAATQGQKIDRLHVPVKMVELSIGGTGT